MASGVTQNTIRDEELARKLQTEEFSEGESNITLRQRLAKLKMDNFRNSLFLNTNRTQNMKSSNSTEDDTVIVIDDDSDDLINIRSSPIVARSSSNNLPRSRSSLTRRRTVNMSPALDNLNRILNQEAMIKADEILARKIQADLNKEYRESQRMANSNSMQQQPPLARIFSENAQVTDSQASNRYAESIEDVIRRFARNTSPDNIQESSSHTRRVFPVTIDNEIIYDLNERYINSNRLSTNERYINSNRLSSNERNWTPTDINRWLNDSDGPNLINRLIENHSSNNNRNTNLFSTHPPHPPRHPRHRSNLNIQFSLNPFNNRVSSGSENRLSIRSYIGIEDNDGDNYEALLRLDERNIKKRVTKEEIESLSRFPYKTIKDSHSDTTCSICFDDYEPKSILIALVCSHKFHSTCIKKWLNQSRRCPLCQKDAINGT